jgi:hypothetical protein
MAELEPILMDGLDATGVDLRFLLEEFQEGVLGVADLKVTAAGAQVDVAAGRGIVKGDHATFQGKYGIINDNVKNSVNFEGGGIPGPQANPVLYQIIAKIWDPAFEGGAGVRRWRLQVVAGTPTSGATIDNRLGANPLTADPWRSAVRLADVHQATNGTLTVRDRRPMAKGFNIHYQTASGQLVGPTSVHTGWQSTAAQFNPSWGMVGWIVESGDAANIWTLDLKCSPSSDSGAADDGCNISTHVDSVHVTGSEQRKLRGVQSLADGFHYRSQFTLPLGRHLIDIRFHPVYANSVYLHRGVGSAVVRIQEHLQPMGALGTW